MQARAADEAVAASAAASEQAGIRNVPDVAFKLYNAERGALHDVAFITELKRQ